MFSCRAIGLPGGARAGIRAPVARRCLPGGRSEARRGPGALGGIPVSGAVFRPRVDLRESRPTCLRLIPPIVRPGRTGKSRQTERPAGAQGQDAEPLPKPLDHHLGAAGRPDRGRPGCSAGLVGDRTAGVDQGTAGTPRLRATANAPARIGGNGFGAVLRASGDPLCRGSRVRGRVEMAHAASRPLRHGLITPRDARLRRGATVPAAARRDRGAAGA